MLIHINVTADSSRKNNSEVYRNILSAQVQSIASKLNGPHLPNVSRTKFTVDPLEMHLHK